MQKPNKNKGKNSKNKMHSKPTAKKSNKAHIHIKPHKAVVKPKKHPVQHAAKKAAVNTKNVRKNANIVPKVVVKETLKERREKEAEALEHEHRKQDMKVVEEVFVDPHFTEHLTNTVGDRSVDIVKILYKKPQTDEKIAEKLEMKINEVRRVLNMMNGHGITKYDVTKDNSGWLIFTWRVDAEKLSEYANAHKNAPVAVEAVLQDNCNDFFLCKKCYENNMLILPFDSAIEYSFKCSDCGSKLDMVDRENAKLFIKGLKSK
jgi:transcription initiation factor TFIIE subunit alpha